MRLVWGEVVHIAEARGDLQRLTVRVEGTEAPAIAYPRLSGRCEVGERVLVNTTAVDLGLGTGGFHLVVAREGAGVGVDEPSGGHIMKLRYTPLQCDVLAVEEAASEHAAVMAAATSLEGMPVVCCGLHSQVLPAVAAARQYDPSLRVAYLMTDTASLPLAFSDVVANMREAGLLDATITSGQSFGGDLESVSVHSGLLAARHVAHADLAVVAPGPGITGTATPYGHGGVGAGETINAAAALDGRPVAVLRMSFADPRPRHRGVSHHSLVALRRIALAPAVVAVPVLPSSEARAVDQALEDAGIWERHTRVDVVIDEMPDTRGIAMRSMGRSVAEDPAFFLAACAGGTIAAQMCARDED
ncbi:MAG: DUF3866 family protein [Coriobacteriales bacterium]|nr:DUF3866 family protein [Actinomycetes bacterium]